MALKPGDGLDKWEIAVAKKVVGEFRRRSRILRREEFDDLVQDCLLHWITVRGSLDCDPANPPLGFMATVLRNWLADLVREQGAEKRFGDLGMPSLDATVDGSEDGMTLAESLDASESTQAGEMGETHRHHVRMDLLRAMARLTPSQQRLCVMLGAEGLSVKEAAEQLRIPRGTLYEEIKRIRKVFADHGLDGYLKG
ncbi:MAG: sigma-70 family RNA polymerase sigma factor [Betaproteobacteria bacterium]|nr:sigma-70 family RNA polymerase sigma factor [Betaproteobacteria bacterium]